MATSGGEREDAGPGLLTHILVVTSGYLSYCCLSVISNQSTDSPLTSDVNKAFSSTQLPLTGYFLFFGTILCKP